MVMTTQLSGVGLEGLKPQNVQGAFVSEGGFAQLLTGITTAPSATVTKLEPTAKEHESMSRQPKEVERLDGAALLLQLGVMLSFPQTKAAETPAPAPVILEGGRTPALGSGNTSLNLTAFLTPMLVSPDIQNVIQQRYVIDKNEIEENGINIDLASMVPAQEITNLDTNNLSDSSTGTFGIQENDKKLYISWLSDRLLTAVQQNDKGVVSHSNTTLMSSEKAEAVEVHSRSGSESAREHAMPFPALHTVLTHQPGTHQPIESTTVSYPHLHEQITEAMKRLVMQREEQSVHLRLDPPELGTLEIRIQVEGSAVHAWLTAERDLTRQSLEQQLQQLREQLASRGLQLAHFEVNTGSQGAFERARYSSPTPLPLADSMPRPQLATDSLDLFGQWSAWA